MTSFIFAALAFILFGSTSLVVKSSQLSVTQLIFGRMLLTAALLTPIAMIKWVEIKRISSTSLLRIFATSAAIFLNMICLFASFRLASVAVCISIFYCGPLFTIVVRILRNRYRPNKFEVIGILLALSTILAMLGRGISISSNDSHVVGYLLALIGGLLFGSIQLLQEKSSAVSPVTSLWLQSIFAVICLLPFSLDTGKFLSPKHILDLGLLGLAFTLVPFMLWWTALKMNPNLNPFISYFDPLTAVIISVFILGEQVNQFDIAGTLLLGICGVLPLIKCVMRKREDTIYELT